MATPLKAFQDAKNKSAVAALVKQSIANAAKAGAPVKFVAAKNYKIGNEVMSVFLWVDKPAEFLAVIKKQGGMVKFAEGKALVTKDEKNHHTIVVQTVVPGSSISHNDVSTLIKPAAGNADGYVGTTPEREQAEVDAALSSHSPKQNPAVAAKAMAKASIARAKEEGNLEPDHAPGALDAQGKPKLNIELTDAVIDQIAKVGRESAEYQAFAKSYEALAAKYQFNTDADYKKVPVNIWHDMIRAMAKSGYITAHIPMINNDPYKLIFATKDPNGRMVREELLARCMQGMEVYTRHAAANLDKVVKAVQANKGSTWSFWSGAGAKAAALKEAGNGVVLEGSVGSWFDNIGKFEHLTGVNDMLLWNSMSELYARKAAEYYEKFQFVGFIGAGGGAETTVFVNIERPTLIQVLNVEKQVAVPKIQWRVVVCRKKESEWNGYEGTGAPSIAVSGRQEAVAEVLRRYPAKGTAEYNSL